MRCLFDLLQGALRIWRLSVGGCFMVQNSLPCRTGHAACTCLSLVNEIVVAKSQDCKPRHDLETTCHTEIGPQ